MFLLLKDENLALHKPWQLIRTAVSPQQKLDWFLPACQIRWQTRPVREPSSWNKTIIVDPRLKKEKMRWQQWHIQQYGKVTCKPFGRRANRPWKRFPKEQTASPKDLSAFLKKTKDIWVNWFFFYKNKHSWKFAAIFLSSDQNSISGPNLNSTNSCGALVVCCVLHHVIGLSLYAFWMIVKIQFLGSVLTLQKYLITAVSLPCSTPSH